MLRDFIRDNGGASLFEYALLIGIASAVATLIGAALVPSIRGAIQRAANSLSQSAGW